MSISKITLISLIIGFSYEAACARDTVVSPDITVHAELSGSPENVVTWKSQACTKYTKPDAPARAFVDSEGLTHLIASDSSNWFLTGKSLNVLTIRCSSAFSGKELHNPDQFDNRGWIESTYTRDGRIVIGLVSNDWFPDPKNAASTPHYMSINKALSTDSGYHFSYNSSQHVLATTGFPDAAHQKATIGAATVSNVFPNGPFLNVFIGLRESSARQSGACLFRTQGLDGSGEWTAWNGTSFSPNPNIPETGKVSTSGRCTPVSISFPSPVELRSVSWFSQCNCYVGMFQSFVRKGVNGNVGPGFYLTTSKTLTSWTKPIPVLLQEPGCGAMIFYPSLLDPDSGDRNYFKTGSDPYIYYTRMNRTVCNKGIVDRDLVRQRIHLSVD